MILKNRDVVPGHVPPGQAWWTMLDVEMARNPELDDERRTGASFEVI